MLLAYEKQKQILSSYLIKFLKIYIETNILPLSQLSNYLEKAKMKTLLPYRVSSFIILIFLN